MSAATRARDVGAQRRRRPQDAGAHRAQASRPRRLRAVPRVRRLQPRAFAGVRDLPAPGARRHRARGSRRRARRHRHERDDRPADQGGRARTGGEGADQRGVPRLPHRRVRSVCRPGRRRGGRARHRDHLDGTDRTGAEPPLRDRAGPPDAPEVRPGVRARADRRRARDGGVRLFALGHGIGAGIGDDTVRRSGRSSAGRSRSCSWRRRSRCCSGGRPVAASRRGRGWRSARRRRCCSGRWSRSGSGCSSRRARRSADLRPARRNDRDPALGAAVVDRRPLRGGPRRAARGRARRGVAAAGRAKVEVPAGGGTRVAGSR